MMRAHGIHPNGGPGRAPTARQPKTERNAGPTPTKKSKNKATAFDENMNVDDEEPTALDNVKGENSQDDELLVVKAEQDQDCFIYEGSDLRYEGEDLQFEM
jgi:3-mercaptopyruvate sulfurtransferase SseA